MSDKNKREEIKKYMEKAEQALSISQQLFQDGYLSDAISKSYYAMFYAANGALRAQNIAVSKHSAVIAEFGRVYSKKGLIDPHLHRALIDAFDDRQEADYNIFLEFDEDQVKERIEEAQAFIQAVRSHLKQQDYIKGN